MASYTVRPPLVRSKGKQKGPFVRFLMSVFPVKGDEAFEIIRKIIFIGAVIAFIITGGSLLNDVFGEMRQMYIVSDQIKNDKSNGTMNLTPEEVREIESSKPYIREDLMGLYAKNNDLVGWINIGGDQKIIDEAVVQTDNNDTYLTTDFYGAYSKSGTIYIDHRCKFGADGSAPNFIVMYGHNTYSSTMFSKMTRYYYNKDDPNSQTCLTSFYTAHPTITFDTLAEEGTYKVFAVCLFNTEERYGEVYNYLRRGASFTSADDFNNYVLDIMDRSVILTDVDLTYGDEIICASTCYFPWGMDVENVRCAVFARKVRDGESPEVDTSKVTRNYYWKGWQQAIDGNLCGNGQRVWDYNKYLLSYNG